jgi:branched-subunit amino acid ABC-type transport system permease component
MATLITTHDRGASPARALVLTALLALAYWASLLVLQQVLRPLTRGSDLAIVASTLAVVALFQPARQRIQALVDRRLYRHEYDAARTLETFRARLRSEIDLDNLSTELLSAFEQTIQPSHASIWLRHVERRR